LKSNFCNHYASFQKQSTYIHSHLFIVVIFATHVNLNYLLY